MDSLMAENEEEGAESLTEETLNWIRVADMIGSTLEEVCSMAEVERNELLSLLPAIDQHKEEDTGNHALGENQDSKMDEKRKDEARARVIDELHRDVEMVKIQLVDLKSIPSDDEIFAYLEAHLKEEKRIQIVSDELRGTNIAESQSKNPSLSRVEENEQTGTSTSKSGHFTEAKKRKLSSSYDETMWPPKVSKIEEDQAVLHGIEGSHSCRPTLDIAEQMIQSVNEDDINAQKISSHSSKELNNNQERMALPKRLETRVEMDKDGCKRMEVLVNTILEMVPNIDQEYLRVRARDLVGHDAAIERFILEILDDPTPPANWRQIFAEPFKQIKPNDGLVKKEKKVMIKKVVNAPSSGHSSPSTHANLETGHTTHKVRYPIVPSELNVKRKPSSPTTISSKASSESIGKHIPEPSNTTQGPKLISVDPSNGPSSASSDDPSKLISAGPSTVTSSNNVTPSNQPLAGPSTVTPSSQLPAGLSTLTPSNQPSNGPITVASSNQPLAGPSTGTPSNQPSNGPSTVASSNQPLAGPSTGTPSNQPSAGPSTASHSDKFLSGPGGLAPQDVLPEEREEVDPEAVWQRDKEAYLLEVFPEYSPEWLVKQIQVFKMNWGTDDGRFNELVAQIMEMDKTNIPSRKEWEKRVKEREELDKWSGNMTVNDMIELYGGDPAKHFNDPKRKGVINNNLYSEHSRMGLLDAFRYASKPIVDKEFRKAQFSFALAHKSLRKMPNTRKTKRQNIEINYPASPSIEFLKEKKFVELRKSIYHEKVKRDDEKRKALEAARLTNALVECECCYNECLDQDMVPCNMGHLYCKECVGESVNVAMGEGKTIILCLGQCAEEINTRELQLALPPNVLSKLLSKRQADEVGAAEIENLVTCPFCPYSTIMENQQDKVVVCRNPDCGRQSCRLCREPDHIPLRCEEVKSKDDIRKRVEEALSDAIIRKCANTKCPASFMKTEGCNKMVCPKCGAVQCYLCKIIVTGYEHFYGQGGEPTKTRVCPLWSDNDELHASEVSKAAQKEAEELKKDGVELEYNPKEGIKLLKTNK